MDGHGVPLLQSEFLAAVHFGPHMGIYAMNLQTIPSSSSQFNSATVDGFANMVSSRTEAGWQCHLVTFMFKQLSGPKAIVLNKMHNEVERVYSTFLTRACRKPNSVPLAQLPLLVGAADLPVFKHDRKKIQLILANAGLHAHAILVTPPRTRLTCSVVDHFQSNKPTYLAGNSLLANLHLEPVTTDHSRVTDYVFKTISRGRVSYDDGVIIFPKAASEMTSPRY